MNQTIEASQPSKLNGRSPTVGDIAHTIIAEQYQRIVKRESKVLADKQPEHLHQMRVSIRRLRTAVKIFAPIITLPKAARESKLRNLAHTLGQLRDLDVQIATLTEDYQPKLSKKEKALLTEGITALQKQRHKALANTQDRLTRPAYYALKTAYESWLEQPTLTPTAQLPLSTALPDLLSPILSKLLLHPGWFIATSDINSDNRPVLHDLRKVCKQVRYQAEFFADCYGAAFQTWIDEIKGLQEQLGRVQDGQVLLDLLSEHLPHSAKMPKLHATIHQEEETALQDWNQIRQQYLDPQFRQQLYQIILQADK